MSIYAQVFFANTVTTETDTAITLSGETYIGIHYCPVKISFSKNRRF